MPVGSPAGACFIGFLGLAILRSLRVFWRYHRGKPTTSREEEKKNNRKKKTRRNENIQQEEEGKLNNNNNKMLKT